MTVFITFILQTIFALTLELLKLDQKRSLLSKAFSSAPGGILGEVQQMFVFQHLLLLSNYDLIL